MTISNEGGKLCCERRKASLTILLNRFRLQALPNFLVTATPRRLNESEFGNISTITYRPIFLAAPRFIRKNCPRFSRRNSLGNDSFRLLLMQRVLLFCDYSRFFCRLQFSFFCENHAQIYGNACFLEMYVSRYLSLFIGVILIVDNHSYPAESLQLF